MSITMSISKRAIKITTALALVAVMSVTAASLLMTGGGGATAFNSDASDTARHMPIPAQYTEQCSNGIAVPDPDNNPGLVSDCAALLASKNTLEGTRGDLNWSADRAISGWYGIGAANNRVTSIFIRTGAGSLNGTIAAELSNLDNLRFLEISHMRLTGAIPSQLGNLANLRQLSLYSNELTGEIPTQLANLANLRILWLNNNQLTGEIPAQLGNFDNIIVLDLRNNQLTGEIPAQLGNLDSSVDLNLSGNQFTGCIPRSLRAPLGNDEIRRIGLPICAAATATPTATSTPRVNATPTPTATSASHAIATPTATSTPRTGATPVATPTPTATPAASGEVLNRLTALETQVAEIPAIKNQIAAMATSIARLEGASAITPPTPTPTATPSPTPSATPVTAPGATPSPTATSVAGTSGNNACITALAGSANVTGNWSAACLSASSPNNRPYYSRFYTFTLSAASEATITLSSADAAPYLFLREGAGTSGIVNQENGAANATTATITATLQPGAYTIEASTWEAETPGAFTLALEITR